MQDPPQLFGSQPHAGSPAGGAAEALPAHAPLAARMRPRTLDEFVGQRDIVGPGSGLRALIEQGRSPSLILWGPPGSGKTTLARLIALTGKAHFIGLSAVTAGVADLRRVIVAARSRAQSGSKTILFIDEIHRFNKAQQDAVLPAVERGDVTFIGATTENPSFEVNSALLSRSRVFVLSPLAPADIETIVERALHDARGLAGRITLEPQARAYLTAMSDGDARVALNALEAAAEVATARDRCAGVTSAHVREALQRRTLRFDPAGDEHYDVISAFIKSLRDSDPDAAVYWLARMLEAGEDPLFVARRILILASEDVGLADPQALPIALAAHQAAHVLGMPEAMFPLCEATLYLALAPKSNSGLAAYAAAKGAIEETGTLPVPLHIRNAASKLMKQLGYGAGYKYAHDYPDAKVEQQHLPDELQGRKFYESSGRGWESAKG
jgi:putative ATPase